MEVSLHSHIGQHPNIIEWFATGEDAVWKWIAMEYAEGGDLFDKIEADVGVSEDIAHFYFTQLVSGVSFMHSKGYQAGEHTTFGQRKPEDRGLWTCHTFRV
jgi:serine/threonine-protein kinase Chk1